jgi:hypothetical protein
MATPLIDYVPFKTKSHWQSVEAHFHDRAGSVLLSRLPIMAAKTLNLHQYGQVSD